MKKVLCVLCALFFAASLPACTSNNINTPPPDTPAATETPASVAATETPLSVPEYDLINSDEYVQGGRKGIGYRIAIGDGATEEEMRAVFSDLCSNDSYVLHTVWFYGLASDVETIGSFSVGMLEETSPGAEPEFTPCTYGEELIASLRNRADAPDATEETSPCP